MAWRASLTASNHSNSTVFIVPMWQILTRSALLLTCFTFYYIRQAGLFAGNVFRAATGFL
jgi:hypothetical protein